MLANHVFVLCTGRCGSTTFARALTAFPDYTARHETRTSVIGPTRVFYPSRHIEVDNRLVWFLGQLDNKYPDARYIHLTRNPAEVIDSFVKREGSPIIRAFQNGILLPARFIDPEESAKEYRHKVCAAYVNTVEANIRWFFRGLAAERHTSFDVSVEHPLEWKAQCMSVKRLLGIKSDEQVARFADYMRTHKHNQGS